MNAHDDILNDLPLFALGSLDADERQVIAAHLATGCAECERALAQWREVVGLLPLAADNSPPQPVRAKLLSRVHPPAAAPRPARRAVWSAPLALAACALLVLVAGDDLRLRSQAAREVEIATAVRQQLGGAQSRYDEVVKQLADTRRDTAALRAALDDARRSLAILQTPNLQLIQFGATTNPTVALGNAEAHLLLNASAQRGVFYAFNLPAIPSDKAYELWWITEHSGPVAAGVFIPGSDRIGRVDVTVPQDAGAVQAAAVSIEPSGGVTKPTGPVILQAAVPRPS